MAAKNMDEIAELLKEVRFKRKLFGGVDEADVWQTIERLQNEYRSVIEAEKERCNVLINERNTVIRKQKTMLARLNGGSREDDSDV